MNFKLLIWIIWKLTTRIKKCSVTISIKNNLDNKDINLSLENKLDRHSLNNKKKIMIY